MTNTRTSLHSECDHALLFHIYSTVKMITLIYQKNCRAAQISDISYQRHVHVWYRRHDQCISQHTQVSQASKKSTFCNTNVNGTSICLVIQSNKNPPDLKTDPEGIFSVQLCVLYKKYLHQDGRNKRNDSRFKLHVNRLRYKIKNSHKPRSHSL